MGKSFLIMVVVAVFFFGAHAHGQNAGPGPEEVASGLAFMTGGFTCLFLGLVVAFKIMK